MTAQVNLLTLVNMEIRQISIPVITEDVEVAKRNGLSVFLSKLSGFITSIPSSLKNIVSWPLKLARNIAYLITFGAKRMSTKFLHFSIMRNKFAAKSTEKIATDYVDYKKSDSKRRFSPKNIVRAVLLLIIASGLIIGGKKLLGSTNPPNKSSTSENQQSVLGARATQDINKDFEFPVKDDTGIKVASFKYTIESAELRDQIIVKGQTATAVNGRTFLIINLKITNDKDKAININTRDYIRLSVNGNKDEWLAPDIHNDPVEVQAISTKYTRVGFPINTSDKNLLLRVGEIDGDKQNIKLNLQ